MRQVDDSVPQDKDHQPVLSDHDGIRISASVTVREAEVAKWWRRRRGSFASSLTPGADARPTQSHDQMTVILHTSPCSAKKLNAIHPGVRCSSRIPGNPAIPPSRRPCHRERAAVCVSYKNQNTPAGDRLTRTRGIYIFAACEDRNTSCIRPFPTRIVERDHRNLLAALPNALRSPTWRSTPQDPTTEANCGGWVSSTRGIRGSTNAMSRRVIRPFQLATVYTRRRKIST